MNISLDSEQVLTHHVHLVQGKLLLLAFLLANVEDTFEVLVLVELGNVARVQHTVDVFEHLLVDDLGVHKEEGRWLAFDTSLHEAELEVISPVTH